MAATKPKRKVATKPKSFPAKSYPKILAAFKAQQASQWGIVDAILEEADRSSGDKRMKDGEALRIANFLAKNGYSVGEVRIRQLYAVGWWVKDHSRFREYSPNRVMHVMVKHRDDYSAAAKVIRSEKSGATMRREAMHPITALQEAGRFLSTCEKSLVGARHTDEEWDELEKAASALRTQIERIRKMIKGEDFKQAIASPSTNGRRKKKLAA